jgi:hypothetical protein
MQSMTSTYKPLWVTDPTEVVASMPKPLPVPVLPTPKPIPARQPSNGVSNWVGKHPILFGISFLVSLCALGPGALLVWYIAWRFGEEY